MIIAVTGANGHVGGNLCRQLILKGHHVKALIYNDESALKGLAVQRIKGDLNDPSSLDELCDGAEVVFHLGALISISGHKKQLERINVNGTHNLLKAIRRSGVKRLVHFSSIHALNHSPLDEPMDESRPLMEHATMMYEATKAKGDKMVQEHIADGLDAIILNPTSILGPHDYKPSLMGQVILRIYKGLLPALVPGGYDWVDVRDVVQASIAAMERGKRGERYILSGRWASVRDLALEMEKVTGRKLVRLMIPTAAARVGVPFIRIYSSLTGQHPLYTFQSLEVLMNGNRMISHEKAERDLEYSSRPLKETLSDTIDWFRENNYLN